MFKEFEISILTVLLRERSLKKVALDIVDGIFLRRPLNVIAADNSNARRGEHKKLLNLYLKKKKKTCSLLALPYLKWLFSKQIISGSLTGCRLILRKKKHKRRAYSRVEHKLL